MVSKSISFPYRTHSDSQSVFLYNHTYSQIKFDTVSHSAKHSIPLVLVLTEYIEDFLINRHVFNIARQYNLCGETGTLYY